MAYVYERLSSYIAGEPPSQVELTNVLKAEGNGVRVAWKAPSIPNGVIQSYQVQVQLLNKEGHLVFTKTYTVMVGELRVYNTVRTCAYVQILPVFLPSYLQGNMTSYFFNLSSVSSERLNVSHMISFRVAAQNAFFISNFSDASYVTLTSGTVKLVSTCTVTMLG